MMCSSRIVCFLAKNVPEVYTVAGLNIAKSGTCDMTLDEALKFVKDRYGLLDTYVEAGGRMLFVVKAENELREIATLKLPGHGIALFANEVKELARRLTTIEALARMKHPEIFK